MKTKFFIKDTLISFFGENLINKILLNKYRFNKVCSEYMAKHATQRNHILFDENYKDLVDNGFVVLNDIHSSELIKKLHNSLYSKMERIRKDQAETNWNTLVYREDGIYRLQDLEEIIPEVNEIIEHPYIKKIVQTYINDKYRVNKIYADYKPDFVHDHTTHLHFDTWTTTIKIFTLLKDVDEGNAPMAYWRGTHKDSKWRRRFDFLLWSGDYVGMAGQVPAHVMRDQEQASNGKIKEFILTGKAGQVVIADVRGIHRASDLRNGYRLELVQKIAA